MKKIFNLLFLLMLAGTVSAQVTWNVKAGVGLSWAPLENEEAISRQNHLVGKLGFGLEMPLSPNFSVMPSLELALKGAKYKSDEDYYSTGTFNMTYLQLPILAAYRMSLNERLNMVLKAGPYIAYALSGKAKSNDNGEIDEEDIFEDFGGKRLDYGLIGGIDFEHHRFVIGAEVEYGFAKWYEFYETFDEYEFRKSAKNLSAYLTIGYKF